MGPENKARMTPAGLFMGCVLLENDIFRDAHGIGA
jgi:hypothetical protein